MPICRTQSISIEQLFVLPHSFMACRLGKRLTWLFKITFFQHTPPEVCALDDVVDAAAAGRHCAVVNFVSAVWIVEGRSVRTASPVTSEVMCAWLVHDHFNLRGVPGQGWHS